MSSITEEKVRSTFSESDLQQKFGFMLKPQQVAGITSVLQGKHTFVALPTGFGKSAVYVLPPLLLDVLEPDQVHIAVVVSPLRSLMTDQVESLKKKGIAAIKVGTDIASTEMIDVKAGKYNLVFISPELFSKFGEELIKSPAYRQRLVFVAFDEAHCLVQWGDDFRPAYKESAAVVSWAPSVPILCLTATVNDRMKKSILESLYLQQKEIELIAAIPDRENIYLSIRKGKDVEELDFLIEELRQKGSSTKKTVVYCRSINAVSAIWLRVCSKLGNLAFAGGIRNSSYRLIEQFHAHLSEDKFKSIMADFVQDCSTVRLLISTIGFGMGVDVKDIKRVIHWGCSKDAMCYWQEVGRAGRDGSDCEAVLFHVPSIRNVDQEFKDLVLNCLKEDGPCFRKEILKKVTLSHIYKDPAKAQKCCSNCEQSD